MSGNEIQLPDSAASRRHARVEFDGQNCTVTDLNSMLNKFTQMQQMMKKFGKLQRMMARMGGGVPGMLRGW